MGDLGEFVEENREILTSKIPGVLTCLHTTLRHNFPTAPMSFTSIVDYAEDVLPLLAGFLCHRDLAKLETACMKHGVFDIVKQSIVRRDNNFNCHCCRCNVHPVGCLQWVKNRGLELPSFKVSPLDNCNRGVLEFVIENNIPFDLHSKFLEFDNYFLFPDAANVICRDLMLKSHSGLVNFIINPFWTGFIWRVHNMPGTRHHIYYTYGTKSMHYAKWEYDPPAPWYGPSSPAFSPTSPAMNPSTSPVGNEEEQDTPGGKFAEWCRSYRRVIRESLEYQDGCLDRSRYSLLVARRQMVHLVTSERLRQMCCAILFEFGIKIGEFDQNVLQLTSEDMANLVL